MLTSLVAEIFSTWWGLVLEVTILGVASLVFLVLEHVLRQLIGPEVSKWGAGRIAALFDSAERFRAVAKALAPFSFTGVAILVLFAILEPSRRVINLGLAILALYVYLVLLRFVRLLWIMVKRVEHLRANTERGLGNV